MALNDKLNYMISYLALGDSYTNGEQVPLQESFPYQLVQMLRKDGLSVCAPEIIAKTGWTTDELLAAMEHTLFLPFYDVITLLIGVNNQYRGRSIIEFEAQLDELIYKAKLLGNEKTKIAMLSIPDWGLMPFAKDRDAKKIAEEIDAFNEVCKKKANQFSIPFIDITTNQRADGNDTSYIAEDGLHPSGKEYAKWAEALFNNFADSKVSFCMHS